VTFRRRAFSTQANAEEQAREDESAGETASEEKQLGNPITWPNPLAGPVHDPEENSPLSFIKGWWYPAGIGLILFGGFISRRRNVNKERAAEEEQKLLAQPQVGDLATGLLR
jgi:hypothetical protein